MTILYISPGVIDSYDSKDHVDAVRWTELFKSLQRAHGDVDAFDLYRCQQSANREIDFYRIDSSERLFIHHESSIRSLVQLYGAERIQLLLRDKTSYLQADFMHWKWLDLESKDYLPLFNEVAVGSMANALEMSLPHIPLGIFARDEIYDANSKTVLYLGRYQPWFNDRLHAIIDELTLVGFDFRIITYPRDAENITPELRDRANVQVLGPIGYGHLVEAVGHARYGLAFLNGGAPNGKVWDYLSLGLPVIFEAGISEEQMLISRGVGLSFKGPLLSGLGASALDFNRPDLSQLRAENSWDTRAEQWLALMGKTTNADISTR